MKPLIISFLLVLSGYSFSQTGYYIANPQKLTWKNYEGKPNPDSIKIGQQANTSTEMYVAYDPYKDLPYVMVFFQPKSWVNSKIVNQWPKWKKDSLLHHERLHLYISLIWGKACKNKLQGLTGLTLKKAHDSSVYFVRKMKDINDKYDQETAHGKNLEKQREWLVNTMITFNSPAYQEIKLDTFEKQKMIGSKTLSKNGNKK